MYVRINAAPKYEREIMQPGIDYDDKRGKKEKKKLHRQDAGCKRNNGELKGEKTSRGDTQDERGRRKKMQKDRFL